MDDHVGLWETLDRDGAGSSGLERPAERSGVSGSRLASLSGIRGN